MKSNEKYANLPVIGTQAPFFRIKAFLHVHLYPATEISQFSFLPHRFVLHWFSSRQNDNKMDDMTLWTAMAMVRYFRCSNSFFTQPCFTWL